MEKNMSSTVSLAERLLTGGLSTLFTAVTVGLGCGIEQCLTETFKYATSTSDMVLGTAAGVALAGLSLLSASGAVWMGKKTVHPD
jgi:hypothetical protein